MCFNQEITLSIPHLTVADKQGIHLKMQEMAILETLIFKNFCVGMPQTPLETGAFGAHTNANDQHLGFSNLGSMHANTCRALAGDESQ